jgi:DNA-binding CsgD family transcriptional regulator
MRHPTKSVVAYASGEKVRDVAALQNHLSHCDVCRDRVVFIQRFLETLRTQKAGEQHKDDATTILGKKHIGKKGEIPLTMQGLNRLEAQVLLYRLDNMSNADIAKKIGVSERLVMHAFVSADTKIRTRHGSRIARKELEEFATLLSPAELNVLRRHK